MTDELRAAAERWRKDNYMRPLPSGSGYYRANREKEADQQLLADYAAAQLAAPPEASEEREPTPVEIVLDNDRLRRQLAKVRQEAAQVKHDENVTSAELICAADELAAARADAERDARLIAGLTAKVADARADAERRSGELLAALANIQHQCNRLHPSCVELRRNICEIATAALAAAPDGDKTMSEKTHDFTSLVCIYAQLLPRIRESGKRLGYAIAIHGTMKRDLDLLAVPWTEDAAEPAALLAEIQSAVGGYIIGDGVTPNGHVSEEPTKQPHGRLSWNICWGGRPFIDLSIMPRTAPDAGPSDAAVGESPERVSKCSEPPNGPGGWIAYHANGCPLMNEEGIPLRFATEAAAMEAIRTA